MLFQRAAFSHATKCWRVFLKSGFAGLLLFAIEIVECEMSARCYCTDMRGAYMRVSYDCAYKMRQMEVGKGREFSQLGCDEMSSENGCVRYVCSHFGMRNKAVFLHAAIKQARVKEGAVV